MTDQKPPECFVKMARDAASTGDVCERDDCWYDKPCMGCAILQNTVALALQRVAERVRERAASEVDFVEMRDPSHRPAGNYIRALDFEEIFREGQ